MAQRLFTLHPACEGCVEVVKELVAAGANVSQATDDGWTPLYSASYNGRVEVVKELIVAGANVNQATDDGQTPYIVHPIMGAWRW